MKKAILLFLSFFILSQIAFGKQWIMFFADLGQIDHPMQNDPSKGGHAFVSFVQEDPIKKQTLVDAWGFNPRNPDDGVGFISYIKGDVKDDLHRQKEIGFMIEVTTAEFQACLKTKDYWVNTKYSVTMRNCVDFTRDIVNTLNEMRKTSKNSLKQPIGLYLVPSEYIQTLKTLNKSLEYKGLIGNVQPNQSFPESDNLLSEGAAKAVKGAARNFFKWYEQTGEKQFYLDFVLNKYGKVAGEEDPCPCTISQKAVMTYTALIKKNSAYFSESYLTNFNKEITRLSTKVQKLKRTDFYIIEDVAITNYPVYTGNGGNPEFGKEDFYTDNNKIKWDITIPTSKNATINIIYPGNDYPMNIEMVKEGDAWKLAKPIGVKLK